MCTIHDKYFSTDSENVHRLIMDGGLHLAIPMHKSIDLKTSTDLFAGAEKHSYAYTASQHCLNTKLAIKHKRDHLCA